jgi:hypothetical protein
LEFGCASYDFFDGAFLEFGLLAAAVVVAALLCSIGAVATLRIRLDAEDLFTFARDRLGCCDWAWEGDRSNGGFRG